MNERMSDDLVARLRFLGHYLTDHSRAETTYGQREVTRMAMESAANRIEELERELADAKAIIAKMYRWLA